jgi:hypothetical protein
MVLRAKILILREKCKPYLCFLLALILCIEEGEEGLDEDFYLRPALYRHQKIAFAIFNLPKSCPKVTMI